LSTALLVDNNGLTVHWMEPRDLNFADMSFEVQSANGVSSRFANPALAMVDSSIRWLDQGTSPGAVRAMLTANGSDGR
jgi:hypothetical protein